MKRDFLSLSDLGPGGIERLLELSAVLHKTRGTSDHPRPMAGRSASAIYGVHQFTHDQAALRSLEARIRAADLDTSDHLASAKEYLSGAKDQQTRVGLTAALKRSENLVKGLRTKGGPTAAVAISEWTGRTIFDAGLGIWLASIVAIPTRCTTS